MRKKDFEILLIIAVIGLIINALNSYFLFSSYEEIKDVSEKIKKLFNL